MGAIFLMHTFPVRLYLEVTHVLLSGALTGETTMAAKMETTFPVTPVFLVRRPTKVFEMSEVKVEALRCVDFELLPGELIVLLGHRGAANPRS